MILHIQHAIKNGQRPFVGQEASGELAESWHRELIGKNKEPFTVVGPQSHDLSILR